MSAVHAKLVGEQQLSSLAIDVDTSSGHAPGTGIRRVVLLQGPAQQHCSKAVARGLLEPAGPPLRQVRRVRRGSGRCGPSPVVQGSQLTMAPSFQGCRMGGPLLAVRRERGLLTRQTACPACRAAGPTVGGWDVASGLPRRWRALPRHSHAMLSMAGPDHRRTEELHRTSLSDWPAWHWS